MKKGKFIQSSFFAQSDRTSFQKPYRGVKKISAYFYASPSIYLKVSPPTQWIVLASSKFP